MLSRVVTRRFTTLNPCGKPFHFLPGHVLHDCAPLPDGQHVVCYAGTLTARERFEIDLPTLRTCTQKI